MMRDLRADGLTVACDHVEHTCRQQLALREQLGEPAARPAAQEPVEISHDDLDREAQPRAGRDLTDGLAGASMA